LPEDEQTSNHGGGGRYNAILEFKGSKLKKERKKEEEEKSESMKGKMRKEKMGMYDIKIK
jgi:hypothetical protein